MRLNFIEIFSKELAIETRSRREQDLEFFRKRYLDQLSKRSNDLSFVTDKMPLNFRYLGLICDTFPDAKIVHVKRNPGAVCWSNYKHLFESKNLSYSYNIDDICAYYGLYGDLMQFWEKTYANRIYNLDYETLTTFQKQETKRLIKCLGLNWDKECLSPQNNKRSVRTASSLQVRKRIYQGSSERWLKFKPFLGNSFDTLKAF